MRALSFFQGEYLKENAKCVFRLAEHRDSVSNLLVGILYGR